VRFLLQAPDDPSLLVSAADIWSGKSKQVQKLARAYREPIESLLEALGRAARLFAPLQLALQSGKPESLALDPQLAWTFLGEGAALLGEAGFGVMVPGEPTRGGQRRRQLRLRVGGNGRKSSKVAGAVKGAASLALDELIASSVIHCSPLPMRPSELRELFSLSRSALVVEGEEREAS